MINITQHSMHVCMYMHIICLSAYVLLLDLNLHYFDAGGFKKLLLHWSVVL